MIWHMVLWGTVVVVVTVVFLLVVSAVREPQERREAFTYWVREQRGETGWHVWLPDGYDRYKRDFEAGRYPES
jgi:hypothetical protein